MNPMQQMKDPAAGVSRELLPHLHLLSKNRYPVTNNPSLETIVAYLLEAPKTVREGQPVQWQYLDCPQDGTLFLTWQPPDLGVNFASDGYVWADQEQPFNSDVRGFTLQMFMHKSGFRPQAEAMACHSRRRYRLLPTQQSMGGPVPDASLWLIHYSKATPRDHVPAASVPVSPPVHAQLQQRRMIMSAGALARKEFMLHDRNNWPTINLPGGLGRHGAGGQVGPNTHRRGQSLPGHEPTIEEEEDVSRGDALDFMTPRDISRMRYEQHHEWMEEILESPYSTMQIVPPSLGLGRKGELEALTKDFFDAPTGTLPEPGAEATVTKVGKLDPGKAEEFTKLANQKLADMQSELQKLKQVHQRRMEKLRRVTALGTAEKKLRSAPSEFSQRKSVANGLFNSGRAESDPVDEIVKEVEETVGKRIDRVKNVTCVSKGGYQEMQTNNAPNLEPTQASTTLSKPIPSVSNVGLQQPQQPQHQHQQHQQHQQHHQHQHQHQHQQQQPPTPVQQAQQQPQSVPPQMPNQSGSTSEMSNPPQTSQLMPQNEQARESSDNEPPSIGGGAADLEMAELDDEPHGDDGLGDANDWVMVDDSNAGDNMDTPSMDNLVKSMGDSDQAQDTTPLNTGFTPGASADQTPQPINQQHLKPDADQQPMGHTPLDTADFEFDDVNTAGDALADYGADEDLNLDDMDDSAFGDAFHANEDHDLS